MIWRHNWMKPSIEMTSPGCWHSSHINTPTHELDCNVWRRSKFINLLQRQVARLTYSHVLCRRWVVLRWQVATLRQPALLWRSCQWLAYLGQFCLLLPFLKCDSLLLHIFFISIDYNYIFSCEGTTAHMAVLWRSLFECAFGEYTAALEKIHKPGVGSETAVAWKCTSTVRSVI